MHAAAFGRAVFALMQQSTYVSKNQQTDHCGRGRSTTLDVEEIVTVRANPFPTAGLAEYR